MKKMKTKYNIYEIYEYAKNVLEKTGFKLINISRKTEARYYIWPGYNYQLRLGVHRIRLTNHHLKHLVVAYLTFAPDNKNYPDELRINSEGIDARIASAVGYYFIKCKDNKFPYIDNKPFKPIK